ncbi:unnamed protein product [Pelagomonas calceolata]|uniref:Uncharacterized protein n=1 Tax=Pelagomonas calceolata TaxID=35677 RepID=A0A8J2WFY0_9STRA|nr:unnamed protein product [Pelagomonas calceolata]
MLCHSFLHATLLRDLLRLARGGFPLLALEAALVRQLAVVRVHALRLALAGPLRARPLEVLEDGRGARRVGAPRGRDAQELALAAARGPRRPLALAGDDGVELAERRRRDLGALERALDAGLALLFPLQVDGQAGRHALRLGPSFLFAGPRVVGVALRGVLGDARLLLGARLLARVHALGRVALGDLDDRRVRLVAAHLVVAPGRRPLLPLLVPGHAGPLLFGGDALLLGELLPLRLGARLGHGLFARQRRRRGGQRDDGALVRLFDGQRKQPGDQQLRRVARLRRQRFARFRGHFVRGAQVVQVQGDVLFDVWLGHCYVAPLLQAS